MAYSEVFALSVFLVTNKATTMATSSPKPSLTPAFLALLVLAVIAYLLFTDLKSSRIEHNVSPAIEIIETPLTIITPTADAPNSEQITEQEADIFVKNLATTDEFITINENEDKFVRHDSVIVLPDLEYVATTKKTLIDDQRLNPETPLTLKYVTHEKVETTLAKLSDSLEDKTATITIINADGIQISAALADLLSQKDLVLDSAIIQLVSQQHRIETTVGDLKNISLADEQPLIATISHGSKAVTLKEITQSDALTDDALFYLHRVTEHDVQGLWGIVQTGLIDKFRHGLQIEGIALNKEMTQAIIPADADEKLPSGFSSFLGKILNNKVDNSFVYNLKTRSMGRDANLIHPGQQLILIHFSPVELKQIYQFFSARRNQGIETFAITN